MSAHEYPSEVLRALARAAEAALPEEACGALFGPSAEATIITRVVPLPNVHPGPRSKAYAVCDLAHLRALEVAKARGEREKGLYHSHPDGGLALSAADLAGFIHRDGPLFPGVDIVVIGTLRGRASGLRVYQLDGRGRPRVALERALG